VRLTTGSSTKPQPYSLKMARRQLIIFLSFFILRKITATMVVSAAARQVRTKVLKQMTGGLVICAIPLAFWWKSAVDERKAIAEEVRTRIRIPSVSTTDDLLMEKCQPGDVILFDRRCTKCASGPWAALSCLTQKQFLCNTSKVARSVEDGNFDHIGKSIQREW